MTDYPVTIADRTVTVRAFNAMHALDIADEMVSAHNMSTKEG